MQYYICTSHIKRKVVKMTKKMWIYGKFLTRFFYKSLFKNKKR